ncbi:MAG TPA: asparaginase [bacterium]
MSEILAKIIRNERVESIHRGDIAVVDADGNLVASVGDPSHATYMRSAAKPVQIMPLLEDGVDQHFGLTDPELAVIMASHNGEDIHVHAVESILKKIGLNAGHLKCGFHPPMHAPAAAQHAKNNLPKSPLYNNCSGKHAGMLAVAKFHNWPLETYLAPNHPLQERIKERMAFFSGLPENEIGVGVDGCSAPVFFLPLKNMARIYANLAAGRTPTAFRVFEIKTAHPKMIAGSERFDTELMQAMAGRMVSKVGAEGIRCLAVQGERSLGIALKIADGSKRASEAVLIEALRQLGLISESELNALASFLQPTIANFAGIATGVIRAEFKLAFSKRIVG